MSDILHCWLWRWREPHGRDAVSLYELRAAPRWQQKWIWGPQSYNHTGINFANILMSLYMDSCLELGQHLDTCPVIPWAEKQVMPYLNFWPTELWTSKWVLHATKFVVICYVTVVYKNNNNSVPSHITESNPVFLKSLQFPPWPVPSFLKVSYIEDSLLSSLLTCSPAHTDFLPFLEVPWTCKYVSNPYFFFVLLTS